MTVYNRKMFRKKGGGTVGIMASGPELIKAQSGVSVNLGGGSTATRSGFPGLRAFGGLGQNIPMAGKVPGLNKFGNPVFGPLSAFGDEGKRITSAQTGFPLSYLLAGDETRKRMFDEEGEKAKAFYEKEALKKQGLIEPDVKPTRSDAYDAGFRNLGPGINQTISDIMTRNPVDDSTFITDDKDKDKDTKTNEKKSIYNQTTNTDADNEIETVVINKKGEGTEVKGTGAAVKGKGKADGNSETTKGKWSLYVNKLQQDLTKGKVVDAADSTLKAHGFDKDTVKEMNTEDKVKEVRGIIENIYGRKTPDSKNMGLEEDLAGMEAIMLGLSIAAGESPDALTNVIRGSKDYVGKKAARLREELKQKKQDQKDLDMLTLKTVLQREDKKSDRDFQEKIVKLNQNHDMKKISTQNSNELEKLGIQLDFKTYLNESNQTFQWNMKKVDVDIANVKMKNEFKMLTKKLASSELIAQNQQLGADARKAAEIEAAETRAIIGNFDKGYGLAFIEGKNKELTGDDLINYAMENGKKFAKNSLLTGPDSLRRLVINNAGTIMKEQNVDFGEATQIIYNAILNDDKLNRVFAKDIEALGLNLNLGTQEKKAPIDLTSK